MGRERTRKGKYLLLYPACCITLLLGIWGCANFLGKWEGEGRLARARTLLAKGKYEASLREAKEVLGLYPRTLGEEALFQMGLIYAYPKNPDRDYNRALECFHGVIKDFPQSKIKDQAGVWVLFLQEIMDKEREIGNLKDQLLRLKEIDLGIEEKKNQAK